MNEGIRDYYVLPGIDMTWENLRVEQRRLIGKQRTGRVPGVKSKTSVESMVSAYRKESQRQKLMIKKARVCDARLSFIVTAFNKLLADENFFTLLRAESLATIPKYRFFWDHSG